MWLCFRYRSDVSVSYREIFILFSLGRLTSYQEYYGNQTKITLFTLETFFFDHFEWCTQIYFCSKPENMLLWSGDFIFLFFFIFKALHLLTFIATNINIQWSLESSHLLTEGYFSSPKNKKPLLYPQYCYNMSHFDIFKNLNVFTQVARPSGLKIWMFSFLYLMLCNLKHIAYWIIILLRLNYLNYYSKHYIIAFKLVHIMNNRINFGCNHYKNWSLSLEWLQLKHSSVL